MTNHKPTPLINITDEMPAEGERVLVYSEQDDKFGTAKLSYKKKYGEVMPVWDHEGTMDFSPISHWLPRPVKE